MSSRALPLALLLGLSSTFAPSVCSADIDDWGDLPVYQPSPERFSLELRPFGLYFPDLGSAFDTFFSGDIGPLISGEFNALIFRFRGFGFLGAGFGGGWVAYSGNTVATSTGERTDENTGLELVWGTGHLLLRVDALARQLDIPVVLSAKVGPDFFYWATGPRNGTGADGISVGLRVGGQVALELDFLSRRDARRLDADWGINHSLVTVDLFYSFAGQFTDRMLPVGGLGLTIGLGFTF